MLQSLIASLEAAEAQAGSSAAAAGPGSAAGSSGSSNTANAFEAILQQLLSREIMYEPIVAICEHVSRILSPSALFVFSYLDGL